MEKGRLIEKSYEIFSNFKQPVRYTIHGDWCLECNDHEETLNKATRKFLTIKQIGRSSWSPIPNLNPEAMAYFMPRLIEFAVENVNDFENHPFIVRFLYWVMDGPESDAHKLLCTTHKQIVLETLLFIRKHYSDVIEDECMEDELDTAIKNWGGTYLKPTTAIP
ncbi:hypothetical protein DENIS_1938 [Desulfonema ishimotonii]|uniref:Uncharacterized protein n=1 Tax=Desulfonema ishimotonii TaxID=45657 RepID=A0A401FVJ3_9BACT|nr:hypothetical protein [Desulfonema ishimotonii]GBC60978.1 hypothetical protein DENIS_1938 [Desulfonema ishimotonii]